MSGPQERAYLERRRAEAKANAETAADPGIARIHREFAERYERALAEDEPHEATPLTA